MNQCSKLGIKACNSCLNVIGSSGLLAYALMPIGYESATRLLLTSKSKQPINTHRAFIVAIFAAFTN